MIDFNIILSTIILDINGLNMSIKAEIVRMNNKARTNYILTKMHFKYSRNKEPESKRLGVRNTMPTLSMKKLDWLS